MALVWWTKRTWSRLQETRVSDGFSLRYLLRISGTEPSLSNRDCFKWTFYQRVYYLCWRKTFEETTNNFRQKRASQNWLKWDLLAIAWKRQQTTLSALNSHRNSDAGESLPGSSNLRPVVGPNIWSKADIGPTTYAAPGPFTKLQICGRVLHWRARACYSVNSCLSPPELTTVSGGIYDQKLI